MHGASRKAAQFHACGRFGRFGLACPFVKEPFDFEDNVPDEVPDTPIPLLLGAARRARASRLSTLEEAERIVAASADAIPLGAGGKSLAEGLRGPAVAVGVGAAAGVAIKAVAGSIQRGGFGGLQFPQIFSPERILGPAR